MKECQNCKKDFIIEPDDFSFYEKIKVPSPTFCPECRMQRRFAWRNERTLHRRKCGLTGKDVITCFSPNSGVTVYDRDEWWSDKWDPLEYGITYDFKVPFFEQFKKLLNTVHMPTVFNGRSTNSNYSNHIGEFKDGYLAFAGWEGENITYASRCNGSKDCMDVFAVSDSQMCYDDVRSVKLYQSFFSLDSEACSNSYFLYDCKACTDCFGCTNLRSKAYYIFNQPYSREEYFEKIKSFDLGSHKNLETMRKKFEELKLGALRKFAHMVNTKNVTGDNVVNAANSQQCFDMINEMKDCKYQVHGGWKLNESYDGYGTGAGAELLYEALDTGAQGSRFFFDLVVWTGHDVQYSYNCQSCENCFGCIGVRSKSYCIFNKQYTKEEYETLVPKIIGHMNAMPYKDKEGREYRYGEFFPIELSPFGYNETIAQDYFPLERSEAQMRGYIWVDKEASEHQPTIKAENLPDHIKDADDAILKEVIECSGCQRVYRIIKRELDFLKRFNIALPRKCFECRHQDRFHQVNFPRLYNRQCQCTGSVTRNAQRVASDQTLQATRYANSSSHLHGDELCPNEFETTYAPDRPEVVYCEACYNAEIV